LEKGREIEKGGELRVAREKERGTEAAKAVASEMRGSASMALLGFSERDLENLEPQISAHKKHQNLRSTNPNF
jgi:hypothetical protein